MEVSGLFKGLNMTVPTTRRRILPHTMSTGFSDRAHLSYYNNNRSRIIASSSIDGLSTQQDSTFVDILTATQRSVAYSKRVKAANKERRKEEKAKVKASRQKDKAKVKASRQKDKAKLKSCKNDSSSSSSSDSETDMKMRRRSGFMASMSPESIVEAIKPVQKVEVCMGGKCWKSGGSALMADMEGRYGQNCVVSTKCMGKCGSAPNARVVFTPDTTTVSPVPKVEVCVGGKCRKSGGAALLAEMEGRYGQNVVVSCKCMGKCSSAPNARMVFNPDSTADSRDITDTYSCVE